MSKPTFDELPEAAAKLNEKHGKHLYFRKSLIDDWLNKGRQMDYLTMKAPLAENLSRNKW